MSKILRYVRLIVPAVAAIFFAPAALAVTCTSVATGNWNLPANWSGCVGGNGPVANTPGSADTAVIANTHTITANVAITAGAVTVNTGGTLNIAGANWTVNGATNVSGTLGHTNTGGNEIYAGLLTILAGGTWNNSINEAVVFRGGITNNGTFTGGTATQTFNTNSQAIGGTSPINFGGIVAVTGAITITNNNTNVVTITGNLTGSNVASTWVNNTNSTLNYGGAAAPMGTRVFTASAAGNTVNYTLAGAQTVKAATYNNLTLSGSGAKTTTGVTVNGILSMEGTATASAAPTYGANATLQYNTATARLAGVEWITPFAATGGVIIANTGAITLNAAKVFNTSVPLTINAGAILATNNLQVTFGGNFVNNGGTFAAGSSPIIIANTMAAQSIAGFTTTGLVSMTKTAGTATFAGNVNAAGLTINGTGGTLNLGAGLTHTVTGAWTTTAGALNGGSSILNIGGSCSVPPPGATFTAGTGTVNWNAAGAQTVCQYAYYNLGLSNSGAKTMTGVTTIGGSLNISGTATMTGNAAFTVGGALNYSSTGTTTLTAATPVSIGSFNQTAGTITAGANTVTVSGNWNETGTFTSTGTVTFNGTAAQTISGISPVTFSTLNVTNAANPNITLAATNVTVTTLTGTATLTPSCPDYTLTSATPAQVLHSCPTVVNSINRANPDPTSAATVSWTVIFNQSVTGVDATAFGLAASGLSGAHITSVTGSGTTWTVTANTGIGAGTLGLNQTGPGAVVPTLSGTFTGEVYAITATPALAEYRMDEAAWNGTAGEAIDSGTGGFNGTAAGLTTKPTTSNTSPAIAGNPGTCRYGVFNRSNKDYLALAGFPNLAAGAGDFTITAWINVADNTLPGQRIFIDDETNTSPGGWGFSVGETATFGVGGLRFYYRQPSVYTLDTVPIPSNQWLFVALSVRLAAGANASSATIYAWNTAGTLVTSNTGTFTWVAGSDPGPSSIGGETNASGEGTNAFGFGGNLDEVRVYQKELSQAALAAIAAQTHACPINIPDHLVIQSSGSGLTCAVSTLTVVACQDATCATPYTLGVSGTLSATGTPTVNWDGTTGGAAGAGFVIPNGSSSVTKNVQVATAGSVVFGITSPSPVPASATSCNFGSPSCTFTADTAGFIFSDTTAPGNTYTIPAQVSGIATPTLYLRAVQASTTNAAVCTPAIIGQTTAVNIGYACNNPATCQAGSLATINATAIASGGASVSLNFDGNGSAPITVHYDDVGQITLNANKTVTPFGGSTPVTLNGSSNAFVVAPHHFDFSGITAGLIKAGNNFSATVTAYNGLGTPMATPNFGKESAPEGVTLVSNLASGNNPTLANNVIAGTEFGAGGMVSDPDGVATVNNLSWGEVGIITLTANLTSGSYLGSGLTATGTSGSVGRHTPDHFDTVVTGGMPCPTGLSCPLLFNGFVYSGQAFTTNVIARNLAGATTLNYDNALGYSKAVTLTAWDAKGSTTTQNPPAATPGTLTNNAVAAAAFTNGATIAGTPATPSYTLPNPYPSPTPAVPTDIYIRAVDTDAVTSLLAIPANSVEGGVKVVSGHTKISNAHGSELLTLPIGVTVQYWNGTNYVTSTTDSVTSFASTNVVFTNCQKNLSTGAAPPNNCKPIVAVATPPASVVFVNGVGSFKLSAPGAGNNGSADLTINFPSYLPSNTARATLGVYKGNNNFIYLRESY